MGKKRLNTVGLDTNIFIYYFQAHKLYGPKVKTWFEKFKNKETSAVTSIISKSELLSYKRPQSTIESLRSQFESVPNLRVCDVDNKIALKAAEFRRKYGFRLPDAIQLATAIAHKANAFLTNDEKLKNCKEIKVIVIK